MRNNNYEKDGVKYCGMQMIVSGFEFCESKGSSGQSAPQYGQPDSDGFQNVPDGIDEELPFM